MQSSLTMNSACYQRDVILFFDTKIRFQSVCDCSMELLLGQLHLVIVWNISFINLFNILIQNLPN